MNLRRVSFGILLSSILVVPVWLMLGRALFGAPIGSGAIWQAIFSPLIMLMIGGVFLITYIRKDVRERRELTARDSAITMPWLAAWFVLGLCITDGTDASQGSALTAIAGSDALQLSNALASILLLGVIVWGGVIAWLQVIALLRDTQQRLKNFAEEVNERAGVRQAPVQAEARFEKLDGPQAGQQIRIDRGGDAAK